MKIIGFIEDIVKNGTAQILTITEIDSVKGTEVIVFKSLDISEKPYFMKLLSKYGKYEYNEGTTDRGYYEEFIISF